MPFSTGTLWNFFVLRHDMEQICPVTTGASETQKNTHLFKFYRRKTDFFPNRKTHIWLGDLQTCWNSLFWVVIGETKSLLQIE